MLRGCVFCNYLQPAWRKVRFGRCIRYKWRILIRRIAVFIGSVFAGQKKQRAHGFCLEPSIRRRFFLRRRFCFWPRLGSKKTG